MSFESIENLNAEELALLYDDVIEGAVNIAQCACLSNETCNYNGSYNTYDYGVNTSVCIAFTFNKTYISSAQCATFCKENCGGAESHWWAYRQQSCTEGQYGCQYNPAGCSPCTIRSGNSYTLLCR